MNSVPETSLRLMTARCVCRLLPPLLASRVRAWLYPMDRALGDDLDFTMRSITGSVFAGRSCDFHAYPFSVQGYYEWRNLAIALAICRPGDTILEIGANVGTETVGFRDVVGEAGRVIAVEPFPENVHRLESLVELNGWQNVEVMPMALGHCTGTASFVAPQDQTATGVGHIRGTNEQPAAAVVQVPCARLDDLAPRLGPVQAVFIDTEGAECNILRGGEGFLRQVQPFIVLEA